MLQPFLRYGANKKTVVDLVTEKKNTIGNHNYSHHYNSGKAKHYRGRNLKTATCVHMMQRKASSNSFWYCDQQTMIRLEPRVKQIVHPQQNHDVDGSSSAKEHTNNEHDATCSSHSKMIIVEHTETVQNSSVTYHTPGHFNTTSYF